MCIHILEYRKQGDIQAAAANVLHTFRLETKFWPQFNQTCQAKPNYPIGNLILLKPYNCELIKLIKNLETIILFSGTMK